MGSVGSVAWTWAWLLFLGVVLRALALGLAALAGAALGLGVASGASPERLSEALVRTALATGPELAVRWAFGALEAATF